MNAVSWQACACMKHWMAHKMWGNAAMMPCVHAHDPVGSPAIENLSGCSGMVVKRLKADLMRNLKVFPKHHPQQERQRWRDSEAQRISCSTRYRTVDDADPIRHS